MLLLFPAYASDISVYFISVMRYLIIIGHRQLAVNLIRIGHTTDPHLNGGPLDERHRGRDESCLVVSPRQLGVGVEVELAQTATMIKKIGSGKHRPMYILTSRLHLPGLPVLTSTVRAYRIINYQQLRRADVNLFSE